METVIIDIVKICSTEFNRIFNNLSLSTIDLMSSYLNSNFLRQLLLFSVLLSSLLIIYIGFFKVKKGVIKSVLSMILICFLITTLNFSFTKLNLFILNSDIVNKSTSMLVNSNFVLYDSFQKLGYTFLLLSISINNMIQVILLSMLIVCLPFSIIYSNNEVTLNTYLKDIIDFILINLVMPIILLTMLPLLKLNPIILVLGSIYIVLNTSNIIRYLTNIKIDNNKKEDIQKNIKEKLYTIN